MPPEIVIKSLIAGLIASFACGCGAIPVMFQRGASLAQHTGLGYGFAGGLMFAASVLNLIWPGLSMTSDRSEMAATMLVVVGVLVGSLFLWLCDKYLSRFDHDDDRWASWGGRTGVLVFIAMSLHSVPEGLAVGVGFASDAISEYDQGLGPLIATAISIHNIPEGLAVALPLRAAGVSGPKCFAAAFLTSRSAFRDTGTVLMMMIRIFGSRCGNRRSRACLLRLQIAWLGSAIGIAMTSNRHLRFRWPSPQESWL